MAVLLSDATYEDLMRIVRKVDALSGDGVANDFHNVRIMQQRAAIQATPQPVRGSVMLRITGNRTKGGMYTANPCSPQTTPIDSSASGALTETSVWVANSAVTVYFKNDREFGSSSHALTTSGTPKTFRAWFYGPDADGTPIYTLDECQS